MSLLVRRIILVAISIAFGFAVTHFGMWAMDTNMVEYGTYFGTTGDGLAYYPLTIIFAALGIGIWLDKWLDCQILPH